MLNQLLLVGLSFLFLVITFPKIRPAFDLSIDPQIHWVFNYLFQNDFPKTQYLIFPHGPLTFINFPLAMGANLQWGLLLNASLRLFFILTFFGLVRLIHPKKWIVFSLLLFVMLEFMELEFIILGAIVNVLLLNFKLEKKRWWFVGVALATLGFYIKMSIGIVAYSILFSYTGYVFFSTCLQKKKIREFIVAIFSIPLAVAVGWMLMYQNLEAFGKYLIGVLELVKGNSDAASVYPNNNWWLLGGCFLSFAIIPFLEKSKKVWFVYILLGFSVFAVWKHSMARQDPWHILKMLAWLIIFFSYLFILHKKIKIQSIALAVASLLFFYGNLKSSVGMFVEEFGWDGYQNFSEAFFYQKEFFEKNKAASLASISNCQISENDLQLIDNQTVDCYPWNYAFVAANDLNWQPRPVIQSYAAYTPWLDEQNAQHFFSEKAPQFLIWETDILKRDIWEAELTSIDNHYLLNDEPQTVAAIFSNYRLVSKDDGYILLEKNKTPALEVSEVQVSAEKKWNEWIEVPYFGDGVLRARLHFEGNFLKWLKAKFYKDEPLFIEYQLANGDLKKYRITAENATQGVWINPFIIRPSTDFRNSITTQIRFSFGNDFFVKNHLKIDWEFFPMKKSAEVGYKNAFEIFGKTKPNTEILLQEKMVISEEAITLASQNFSPNFEMSLQELPSDSITSLLVSASVDLKMDYFVRALLVILVEENGEVVFWESKSIEHFLTNHHLWNFTFFKRTIPKPQSENAIIKSYIWNTGTENISIRNFKVQILQQ